MLIIGPDNQPFATRPDWFNPKRPKAGYRFITEPLFPPMEATIFEGPVRQDDKTVVVRQMTYEWVKDVMGMEHVRLLTPSDVEAFKWADLKYGKAKS